MSNSRGMGRVYQAVYRSRHGELKSCATWRIEYYVNGRRFNEKVESTNRARCRPPAEKQTRRCCGR